MGRTITPDERKELERLGNLLKRYRTLKKYTLEDVSKATNIKLDYISKYENGKKDISFLTLKKFCNFYKIKLSNLFYKTDYPSSKNTVVQLSEELDNLNKKYLATAKKLHNELNELK